MNTKDKVALMAVKIWVAACTDMEIPDRERKGGQKMINLEETSFVVAKRNIYLILHCTLTSNRSTVALLLQEPIQVSYSPEGAEEDHERHW